MRLQQSFRRMQRLDRLLSNLPFPVAECTAVAVGYYLPFLLWKLWDACKTKWKNMRDWYTRKKKDGKLPSGSGASAVRLRARFEHMSFLDGTLVSRRTFNCTAADADEVDDSSSPSDEQATDSLPSNSQATDAFQNVQEQNTRAENQPSSSQTTNTLKKSMKRTMRTPYKVKHKAVRQQMFQKNAKMSRERLGLIRNIRRPQAAETKDEFDDFFSSMASSARKLPRHLQITVKREISNIMFAAEEQAIYDEGYAYQSSPMSPEGSNHEQLHTTYYDKPNSPEP